MWASLSLVSQSMNIGDLVRLKHPFRPLSSSPQVFEFGIIAGFVSPLLENNQLSIITEMLVYLYDPSTGRSFTDAWGEVATYGFYPDEVELDRDRRAPGQ